MLGTNGLFTSPSWPSPYPRNVDCKWFITAENGQAVRLKFTEFDVEEDKVGNFLLLIFCIVSKMLLVTNFFCKCKFQGNCI